MSSEFEKRFDRARLEGREQAQEARGRQARINELIAEATHRCAMAINDSILRDERIAGAFTRDPGPFASGSSFKCAFPGVTRPVNIDVSGTVTCDESQNATMPHQDPSWNSFTVSGSVQAWIAKKKSREYPLQAAFGVSGSVTTNVVELAIEAAEEIAAS